MLINEQDALRDVLAHSVPFKRLYAGERWKIGAPLVWMRAPGPHDQWEGRATQRPLGSDGRVWWTIELPRMPVPVADAVLAGHELLHCLFGGYLPQVAVYEPPRQPYDPVLATVLNELLHGPLIVQTLCAYGFKADVLADLARRCTPDFAAWGAVPYGSDDWLQLLFRVAGHLLTMNAAGSPDGDYERFVRAVARQHAPILVEARALLVTIRHMGYATPDECWGIYNVILARYNLTERLAFVLPGDYVVPEDRTA